MSEREHYREEDELPLGNVAAHYCVPRGTEDVGFAPTQAKPVCVDPAGYIRSEHEADRDGVCFWCSKTRNQFGAFVRLAKRVRVIKLLS